MTRERAFFPWSPAAWLKISGDDAFTFLQGQFTNDLRQLGAKSASYGLWLNHKGRVLADSFVLKAGTAEYWVGSYFCPTQLIKERLEAFIIADDVTVEDVTAEWMGVTIFERAEESGSDVLDDGVFRFDGRRSLQPHTELVFPATMQLAAAIRAKGYEDLDHAGMERLRISDAIPAVPMDLGPGELPNEGGLEDVAISYTKGCYLGQEVMARLKSMGQVRRRLLRVEGVGTAPALPVGVFQGERRIGELRTAIGVDGGFMGLALLNLLHLDRGAGLSFSPGGDSAMNVVN